MPPAATYNFHLFGLLALLLSNSFSFRSLARSLQTRRKDNRAKKAAVAKAGSSDGGSPEAVTAATSSAAASSASSPYDGEEEAEERVRTSRPRPRAGTRQRVAEKISSGDPMLRVAVDMSLSALMSRKEISRLVNQLRRLYGKNMRNDDPAHLYLTGFQPGGVIERECTRQVPGMDNWPVTRTAQLHYEHFKDAPLVYLTPDAEEPLLHVDEEAVRHWRQAGGVVTGTIDALTQLAETGVFVVASDPASHHLMLRCIL